MDERREKKIHESVMNFKKKKERRGRGKGGTTLIRRLLIIIIILIPVNRSSIELCVLSNTFKKKIIRTRTTFFILYKQKQRTNKQKQQTNKQRNAGAILLSVRFFFPSDRKSNTRVIQML